MKMSMSTVVRLAPPCSARGRTGTAYRIHRGTEVRILVRLAGHLMVGAEVEAVVVGAAEAGAEEIPGVFLGLATIGKGVLIVERSARTTRTSMAAAVGVNSSRIPRPHMRVIA